MRSKEAIAGHVFEIIRQLEPNFGREGIKETPDRVAAYLLDITAGHEAKPEDIMKVFEDGAERVDQMVFQGNIPFFSTCEHHMVPFFGVAHMAYIPGGAQVGTGGTEKQRILGLSKFARLLEIFARRLQVQERITNQVADALNEHLKPLGAACVLRARHMCMECRGVQKLGTITMTSALRGAFLNEGPARSEFMQFVAMAESRSPNI